jgi:hypothetical protein
VSEPAARPPGLGRALLASVSGFSSAPLAFLGASLVWSIGFIGAVLLSAREPATILLFGPLLMPLGCGLLRMAALDARGRVVRFGQFSEGVALRFGAKIGLGVAQTGLLLVGGLNLQLGLSMEGLPGAVVTIVAAYVLLASWTAGLAIWPLMTDPRRDAYSVRQRLALGVRLIFARPVLITLAGLLAGGGLYAGTEFIAPLGFIPGLVALMTAHLVLPAADQLDPLEVEDEDR